MPGKRTKNRVLPFQGSKERLFIMNVLQKLLHCGYIAFRVGAKPKPDSLPEIFVSSRYRFVCCAVPLAATQTFRQAFIYDPPLNFNATLHRRSLDNVLDLYPELGSYLKFGVVRNPWSRVVSCYEKVVRNAFSKDKVLSIRTIKDVGHISMHHGLHPQMCFEEFVEWLSSEEGQDAFANRHWMSQYKFLAGAKSHVRCDMVLRLENFEREIQHVFNNLKIPLMRLPIVNATNRQPIKPLHGHYKDYYNTKTKNAIGDRYSRDVDLFSYDF